MALADEGSFTRAAARCHVTQQALSRSIAALERRVGTPLVVRRPRGCSLTSAGLELVGVARELLADPERVEQVVADVAETGRPRAAEHQGRRPPPTGLLRLDTLASSSRRPA
jgi:DNA-binding transcriptional LysR family regulator